MSTHVLTTIAAHSHSPMRTTCLVSFVATLVKTENLVAANTKSHDSGCSCFKVKLMVK